MLGRKTILGAVIVILMGTLKGHAAAWTGEVTITRSTEAAEQVEMLVPLSLQLVDEAITSLSQGWLGMSEEEQDIFLQLYDPSGTGEIDAPYVAKVLENYHKVRVVLAADVKVIYAPRSSICEGKRLYYTDLSYLYVCPYFFEEENEVRKARTLIHEMAHIALLVVDRPYYRSTSKQYAKLTPYGSWITGAPLVGRVAREMLRGDTLYHPDAYAHFALLNSGVNNVCQNV